MASLTAGRLSYLDFFNNPVSKQFLHGKRGWPKTLPGPREITASVPSLVGANARLAEGLSKIFAKHIRNLDLVVCLGKICAAGKSRPGKC